MTATRDVVRLRQALIAPVNSLIQDAVNGLPTLRCMKQTKFYLSILN